MNQLKLRNRRAKIVATLGPACETEKTIEQLFLAGVDVFRLNFSHGSHEDHINKVKIVRKLEKKYNRFICILGDLQGPKFRVGKFSNIKEQLKKNQEFTFDQNTKEGDNKRVYLSHKEIFKSSLVSGIFNPLLFEISPPSVTMHLIVVGDLDFTFNRTFPSLTRSRWPTEIDLNISL